MNRARPFTVGWPEESLVAPAAPHYSSGAFLTLLCDVNSLPVFR